MVPSWWLKTLQNGPAVSQKHCVGRKSLFLVQGLDCCEQGIGFRFCISKVDCYAVLFRGMYGLLWKEFMFVNIWLIKNVIFFANQFSGPAQGYMVLKQMLACEYRVLTTLNWKKRKRGKHFVKIYSVLCFPVCPYQVTLRVNRSNWPHIKAVLFFSESVFVLRACSVYEQDLKKFLLWISWHVASTRICEAVSTHPECFSSILCFLLTLPRWPSGEDVRLGSGRSVVQFPLAPWGFFWVKSYQWLTNWHSSGYPARCLMI